MKASHLLQLIKYLDLNIHQFEKEIKAGNGSIGRLIANDRDISVNLRNKILLRYPNINRSWLDSGKGNVFEKPTTKEQEIRRKLLNLRMQLNDLQTAIREIERIVS